MGCSRWSTPPWPEPYVFDPHALAIRNDSIDRSRSWFGDLCAWTIPTQPGEVVAIRDDGAVLERGQVAVEIGADGRIGGRLIADLGEVVARFTGAPETRRAMMLAWIAVRAAQASPHPVGWTGSRRCEALAARAGRAVTHARTDQLVR